LINNHAILALAGVDEVGSFHELDEIITSLIPLGRAHFLALVPLCTAAIVSLNIGQAVMSPLAL